MNQTPYARVRRMNALMPSPLTDTYTDTVLNPDVITVTNYSNGAHGIYREMTDVVTPDWERIKGTGGIVNNKMDSLEENFSFTVSSFKDTQTHPLAEAGKRWHDYAGYYTAGFESIPSPNGVEGRPMSMRANLYNSGATNKVRSKAAVSARNKVNPVLVQSIVSIAELHKTVAMVTRAARTLGGLGRAIARKGAADEIFDLINGVRRGQAGRAGQLLFGGASRYLEYRYGWRILMMEIQSVIKALDKTVVRKPRAMARSRMSEFRSKDVKNSWFTSNCGTDYYDFTSTENVEASAYVLYEADLKYQSARDWGLAEVPLAAWELIPFSFVVDWFIPIGNWLEAVTPKVGIKVLAEGVTMRETRVVTRVQSSYAPVTSGTIRYARSGLTGATDVFVQTKKWREPSLTGALLRPYVDVKLNVPRALDAIALLATVGRGLSTSIRR